jgi:AraC-like DNA-binding protein
MADTEPAEAYADDAPLMSLFGQPARTKILSVFVAERGRDLSKSEVARQAGVARSTVYDHLDTLTGLGVIEHTRDTQAGHSERYQLNEESPIAETLYELEGVTLRRLLERDDAVD